MGAAAYNRGSRKLSEEISREATPVEAALIRDLNAEPKNAEAQKPFGKIHFTPSHGGWWALCPVTGFGFFHKSLRDAVRSYRVVVTSIAMQMGEVVYIAEPERASEAHAAP